ncbi:MAG: hypothetical protein KGJ89_02440 [Patescibacteria group bacterium]|nr:hypothetical protein [Patescibacteria group bacterium]MDE2015737.1 hypothetical protein [Patescibacteria group bacterium]MDE2226794.1 hypothetical protein [Patescibacteria group bacterium]
MAGEFRTGIFVTGQCFCCCFESSEEIDLVRKKGGKPDNRPTKKSVAILVEEAKNNLMVSHSKCNCPGNRENKLIYGFAKTVMSCESADPTASIAEKIIKGRFFKKPD